MAASHFLRLGKIKGKDGILVALKHNKRENQSSKGSPANIDASRTPLNYALVGQQSAQEIATEAKVLMLRAGIEKPRINAVMGVEVIFSLPVGRHQQNTKPFFEDCLAWLKATFEGELLSFDIHLDERAEHAHAIILPLVDGRMVGSDMVGGKPNLNRLQNEFYESVGRRYGLRRSNLIKLSADLLGIELVEKTNKTFTGIMTSKGKGNANKT